jgi:hypothetical protein
MESMEKRTEQSEAVCGRVLMFCVGFFFGVSNLYYISLELFGMDAWLAQSEGSQTTYRYG